MVKRAIHMFPLLVAIAVIGFGVGLTWTWLVGDSKYLVGVSGVALGVAGMTGLLLRIDAAH